MHNQERIIGLPSVDSTNNHASKMIAEGLLNEGDIVFADYQQKGRGQQGNIWESHSGQNILMSLVLFPAFLELKFIFMLNETIALGVYDYISNKIKSDVSIKWPNDILVGEKKISGILVENSLRSNGVQSCIAGIGVNINQENFSVEAGRPVSLKMILKSGFDSKDEAKKLREKIMKRYAYLKNKSFDAIHESYNKHLFGRYEKRKFKMNNIDFFATITGVTPEGKLNLEKDGGEILRINNKEVEYVWS